MSPDPLSPGRDAGQENVGRGRRGLVLRLVPVLVAAPAALGWWLAGERRALVLAVGLPVVLLADVRSVGVQGDHRTYGHPVVLRPVSSEDAMTADWSRLPHEVIERISTRITNECPQVNRVVLDCTSKPPGTIEWE